MPHRGPAPSKTQGRSPLGLPQFSNFPAAAASLRFLPLCSRGLLPQVPAFRATLRTSAEPDCTCRDPLSKQVVLRALGVRTATSPLWAVSGSCSVVSDSLRPRGLYNPWNSPGQNMEWVEVPFSRASSQPGDQTQFSHICRWILYQLRHQRSLRIPGWVAHPFSRGSFFTS